MDVRYVDLYSAEVNDHPDIAVMLIRRSVPMPVVQLDGEELLFGGGSLPRLIEMLESRGLARVDC